MSVVSQISLPSTPGHNFSSLQVETLTINHIIRAIISFLLFSFVIVYQSHSQSNETCLECHSEPDISMEKKGKTISLHVKLFELKRSVHSKLRCIQCHSGYNPDDFPHKENIKPINCQSCHQNIFTKHPFHPGMKKALLEPQNQLNNCKNCHGTHNIISSKSDESKTHFLHSTEFCGNCHINEKKLHVKSEHFVSLNKNNPNAPTCIYCHKQPITKGNVNDIVKLKLNQEKLCLSCHLDNTDIRTQYSKTLVSYEKSVHGSQLLKGNQKAAACIDCHGSHDLQKATAPHSRISRFKIPDICGKCHISVAHEYESSIHGVALKKGNLDVPGCSYCHGEHNIAPIPDVPPRIFTETHINKSTYVRNKMVYCVVCHADEGIMSKYNILTVKRAHDWLPNQSTHWETVRCVDCHSSYVPPNLSHNILPPEKTVKKCEECHSKNSILMTKLYKHEKQTSREKFGFINGTILSDAYVIGTTRNVLLDTLSLVIFSISLVLLILHALLRWYFRRAGR